MDREQKCPIGSRWQIQGDARIFVVTERSFFGKLTIKQEDRAYFGEMQQRNFLQTFTQLPDAAPVASARVDVRAVFDGVAS
jgi:hypothetical protein